MEEINGETFVDVLDDRRKTKDFYWANKPWEAPICRYSKFRTPKEIKETILKSEKLNCIIQKISEEKNCSQEDVEIQAKAILDEMSHNFQIGTIRFFGYILSKFMKRVYKKILVDKNGAEKLKSTASQYPIIFLPMHRSYADFLLVSYVCFYFDLPVPVIAAGLDFLGLKSLSFLLRGAGAFFIRRSFVDDKLYKEIFAQYVQTHIEGCEYPMEFFIEGTRSRTAKSLVPKLGMLQVILELYFSGKIPDLTVVPISISYDRTLEETLYAYELLGVPKPKESTTSLIKARKVMSDFYGNVYVRFGEQISVKEYFKSYDRSIHNLHPRSMSMCIPEEKLLCRSLAVHVIRMHQCNLVLSPFPVICLILGQPAHTQSGVHLAALETSVNWLEELIKKTGATLYYGQCSRYESIVEQLMVHSNIMDVSQNGYVSLKHGWIQHPESSSCVPRLKNVTVEHALPAMFAYHYGNQAMQLLVHYSMLCLSFCQGSQVQDQDSIFLRYKLLRKLLQLEFVFETNNEEKDFLHSLQSLKEEGVVVSVSDSVLHSNSGDSKFEFLSSLLLPFIEAYFVICQQISQQESVLPDCKKLSLQCQAGLEEAIVQNVLSDYRCLSLDLINNCIAFLVSERALTKIAKKEEIILQLNHSNLLNILVDLETFLPSASDAYSSNSRFAVSSAKL